jgi:hypothetical protein
MKGKIVLVPLYIMEKMESTSMGYSLRETFLK